MLWKIPRIAGDELQIQLETGKKLFVVGANGSGKSALLQFLVTSAPNEAKIERVAAHRQTWLDSGAIRLTAQDRKSFEENKNHWDRHSNARWKEDDGQNRQSAILFDLVARDNSIARSITQSVRDGKTKKAKKMASDSPSPFDELNRLLELGLLPVWLENIKGEEIIAHNRLSGGAGYSIAQMSDGERNAAMLGAKVLTIDPGTILLIDEPERHLHRGSTEAFLSTLFEQREDCCFVVFTHEIVLPSVSPEADVIILRSCRWAGDRGEAWDADFLPGSTELPEDVKNAVLGARRRVLFVEGTRQSLDFPLYQALFPGILVIPKENSSNVERAVIGLRQSQEHHHVEAFGLIDRDGRTSDIVQALEKKQVFALDVHSAEALYYCSDSMDAVARQQAKTLGCDAKQLTRLAKERAVTRIRKEIGTMELAERMAARRCEIQIRNRMLAEAPDWKKLQKDGDPKICVRIKSPYADEVKRFKTLVDNEDLDGLVSSYPLRESGVFCEIARALECASEENYRKVVLSRMRSGGKKLLRRLRDRVGPLSVRLGFDVS